MIYNFQQANLDNRLVFSQLPLLLQDGQSGMLPHTVQKVWLGAHARNSPAKWLHLDLFYVRFPPTLLKNFWPKGQQQ